MEIQNFYAMIYFIMFGLLLLTLLTNFSIARGRLGYALRAIRDNEDAAEASGIFAPTCKVIALGDFRLSHRADGRSLRLLVQLYRACHSL